MMINEYLVCFVLQFKLILINIFNFRYDYNNHIAASIMHRYFLSINEVYQLYQFKNSLKHFCTLFSYINYQLNFVA